MKQALIVALVTVAVASASAHHTASYIYDIKNLVRLKGVVTEVEWKNPHVLLHLDVKRDDGTTVGWVLEARATYIMQRMGMKEDFVKIGDPVEVNVCVAKDGSHKGGLQSIEVSGALPMPVGECAN